MRAKEALTRFQMEKRFVPYRRTTQSQPRRTFLVHQNPRRAILRPQPNRRRIGSPQRRTTSRPSLAGDRTRCRRKTYKPSSDRLQSQSLLSLFDQRACLRSFSLPLSRNGMQEASHAHVHRPQLFSFCFFPFPHSPRGGMGGSASTAHIDQALS